MVVTTYSLVSKEIPVQKEEADKPKKDNVVRNVFTIKVWSCCSKSFIWHCPVFIINDYGYTLSYMHTSSCFVFIRLLHLHRLHSSWSPGTEWFWTKLTTSRTQKCRLPWLCVSWGLVPAGPSLEHPSRITCWTCTLCSSKTKTRQEQSYKRGAFPYSCLTLLPEKNASMMNFNHFLKNLQVISESVSKRLLSLWNYHFVGQEIKDKGLKIPSRSSRESAGVLEEVWRHFFFIARSLLSSH